MEEEIKVNKAIKRAVQDITEWMVENPDKGPMATLINCGMSFYDDSSGQRGAYLEFGACTIARRRAGGKQAIIRDSKYLSFMVRRKLSFQNVNDYGKDGAILTTIGFHNFKKVDVKENGTIFIFDDFLSINLDRSYDISDINKLDEAYADSKHSFILERIPSYYDRLFNRIGITDYRDRLEAFQKKCKKKFGLSMADIVKRDKRNAKEDEN